RVLFWTGGHPYLTQRLCRAIAEEGAITDTPDVDRLCQALFFSPEAQERDDNLVFVRERLLQSEVDRAGLLDLYGHVRGGRRVGDDPANLLAGALRLSGIIRTEGGLLKVRNRVYERVFDRAWVQENMPEAERQRQQAAYRRGLLRAGVLAGTV